MQASAFTSTQIPPFRPAHRRQRSSHANDVQDANVAGRPFAFVPRRRSSNGSPGPGTKNTEEATTPGSLGHVEVLVTDQSSIDVPSPSTPHAFITFPRAKSDSVHGRLPRFEEHVEVTSPSSPTSNMSTPTNMPSKGALRLDLDSRTYCASAAASTQAEAAASVTIAGTVPIPYPASAGPSAAFTAALIRKKSGEPLKPSLKPSAFATWSGAARTRTKSAPSTPVGPKFVHFDAKLEHVKLFLAEQKPLAVSRDGSPTETSECDTDTGYPFPTMSASLRIKPVALPSRLGDSWAFDVRLEKVELEDAVLVGHVLVRNVAFAKRVAARFTLDAWQTTSEVAAKHDASVRGGDFDRFEFRVRLTDYLRDIEAKRLVLCIRYSVEGRDMWDSNGGRNYEVGFERVREEPKKKASVTTKVAVAATTANTPHWNVRRSGLDSMADLRKQLENVVQNGQDADGPPPPLAVRKKAQALRLWVSGRDLGDEDQSSPPRIRSRSPSPLKDKEGAPSLCDTDAPLSARYDFGASLKSPAWRPPTPLIPPTPANSTLKPKQARVRAKSPPAATAASSAFQFPAAGEHQRSMTIPVDSGFTFSPRVPLPRGSPRDSADYADEGAEELHRLNHGENANEDNRSRHHTRAWTQRMSYFDRVAEDAPALQKTSPGTPIVTAATPPTPPRPGFRLNSRSSSSSSSSSESRSPSLSPNGSYLALDAVWGALQTGEDESVASTPSMTTSVSSPSLSPLSSPGHLLRSASEDFPAGTITAMNRAKRPPVDSTPYHSFLDQFCFFTGVNNPLGHSYSSSDRIVPRRVHSASSVEDYFTISPPSNEGSYSPYATLKSPPSGHTTPTRSPIPADFMSNRGLATPRPGTPNEFPPSPMSTPVAG